MRLHHRHKKACTAHTTTIRKKDHLLVHFLHVIQDLIITVSTIPQLYIFMFEDILTMVFADFLSSRRKTSEFMKIETF